MNRSAVMLPEKHHTKPANQAGWRKSDRNLSGNTGIESPDRAIRSGFLWPEKPLVISCSHEQGVQHSWSAGSGAGDVHSACRAEMNESERCPDPLAGIVRLSAPSRARTHASTVFLQQHYPQHVRSKDRT